EVFIDKNVNNEISESILTTKNENYNDSVLSKGELEETIKNKYLLLIQALQDSIFAKEYPVSKWEEKALNTFGSYLNSSERFNEREKNNKSKSPESIDTSLDNSLSDIAHALLNPEPETCSLQVKALNNNISFVLKESYSSMNFKEPINFGDDIKTIQEKFKNWINVNNVATKVQDELEYYKLCHFFKLLNGYAVLYKLVIKELQNNFKNLSLIEKIKN
ncbi:2534_t:CDS:2, partial [Scutellospora calospora]